MKFAIDAGSVYGLYRLQEDRSWRRIYMSNLREAKEKDLLFSDYRELLPVILRENREPFDFSSLDPSAKAELLDAGLDEDDGREVSISPRVLRITKPRRFTFEEMEEVLAKSPDGQKNYLALSLEGRFDMRTPTEIGVPSSNQREVKLVGEEQEALELAELNLYAVWIGPLEFRLGHGYVKLGDYCPPEVVECYKAICKQVPQEMVTEVNEVLLKSEHSRPNNSYECLEEQIRCARQELFLNMLSGWLWHLEEGRLRIGAHNGDMIYNLRRMGKQPRKEEVWSEKHVAAMFESRTMDEKVMWEEVEELTQGFK